MKKALIVGAAMAIFANAYGAPSLADQIAAVHSAEMQKRAADEAAQKTAEAARQEQARQDALRQDQLQRKHDAALAAAQAARKAERDRQLAAAEADKKRAQAYQDQLRSLQIEREQLQLQAMKARVARANDFIDQELRQDAAQTDVVQSRADANRALSQGTKSLLEDTGKARVKNASGWFK